VRAPLRQELAGRLAALEAEGDRPWPSFHPAHWRARRSLEALKAAGGLG